jgi:hypothetical protein
MHLLISSNNTSRVVKLKNGLTTEQVKEYISARESQGFVVKKVKVPGLKTLEKWSDNGVAKATDNCIVEPDGSCVHGCRSWLLELGMI